ncbi:prepilin-type N-terminal cleavage/methylation domain-containing protein [Neisseria leonii]|uniref:prepilin-type N-terminal cleavage/methylation domain-containing protein n=1 Tax=Neisseria leonii TaxID=2995413 RepID=UPI00237B03A9|nr:prepilin-type N-terminal cleavage/methylation domain-containing protein [Neisseria sp. 3986]MDD9326086.1 prepilin-type N-terminal cleavage/methylation domain-containing protein [Neisseria sp. 3986]
MKRQSGFGLMEMAVVLVLAALLAGVAVHSWQHSRAEAAEAAVQTLLWQLLGDIEAENLKRPSEPWDNGRLQTLLAAYPDQGGGYRFSLQVEGGTVYLTALPDRAAARAAWAEVSRGVYWCTQAQAAQNHDETACSRF